MSFIKIENVNKDYQLGKTVIHALKDITFKVEQGDFLSIVGPSGCGKTTLLNVIGCIDRPSRGKVFFHEKDVSFFTDNQEADLRLEKIGFIFQSFNLIPVLNIFENIEFPLILNKTPKRQRKERVNFLIEIVGLAEYVKHKPDELSGGQRQRVAIARALVNNPDLIIADEPTANLDSETGNNILNVMSRLNKEHKVTFIFSTHNPEVMKYAYKIITLKDGRIINISDERQTS